MPRPSAPSAAPRRRRSRATPDPSPWPGFGFVTRAQIRCALGGISDATLDAWIGAGLFPGLEPIGPNRTGLPVEAARAAVLAVPRLVAAQRESRSRASRDAAVAARRARSA